MRARIGSRGSTTLGLVCMVVLLLASLGGWYATWRHYHGAALTPICATSNMRLSIGATDGTAGTQYTHVVATNQGANACTISGYPTVFLSDAGGMTVGSGAAPNALYTPATITLQPNHSAYTAVGFPDHGNFSDPSVCSGPSANVKVYLPSATTPLSAALAQYSCPGFSATAFQTGS